MGLILSELKLEELTDLIAQKIISQIKELPQKVEKHESYLTFKETQKMLRLSGPTLHKYCKKGLVPSYRLGRGLRFKESQIQELIEQGLRFKTKLIS